MSPTHRRGPPSRAIDDAIHAATHGSCPRCHWPAPEKRDVPSLLDAARSLELARAMESAKEAAEMAIEQIDRPNPTRHNLRNAQRDLVRAYTETTRALVLLDVRDLEHKGK